MASADPTNDVRLAELVATLALGQDNAFGQPLESQLRSCVIAMALAAALDLPAADQATVYWVAQLRYIGCTGHAHEVATLFGDEIEMRARTLVTDAANQTEVLRDILTHVGSNRGGLARVRTVLSMLAGGRTFAEMNFRTGCEVADVIAGRLGMTDVVRDALRSTFERWNGKGFPDGARGEAIPLPMRIVHLSQDMEVLARLHSPTDAVREARKRSDRAYDPALVAVFVDLADEVFARLDKVDPWDEVLAIDPVPSRRLRAAALDDALLVMADFADLKSPFTGGHSRGVASLSEAAVTSLGLAAEDAIAARRAGLVHDLGHTAVPNSIWDKPAALTRSERDRVELHPLFTEQMLRRTPGLAVLNPIAACHHERSDGSGYCKGLTASSLTPAARVVAAADCYHALTEARAHRPAHPATMAAAEVRAMVGDGRLDGDAVEAVLAADGHRPRRRSPERPAGLTGREVEVLQLAARGLTTKQIAEQLGISAKTADHHIQHIYTKIGASTRGAAALFAIEHDLVPRG